MARLRCWTGWAYSDRGLPKPEPTQTGASAQCDSRMRHAARCTESDTAPDTRPESQIGALVRRIEHSGNSGVTNRSHEPQPALGDTSIDHADEGTIAAAVRLHLPIARGRIDWADADVAPMVVGMRCRNNRVQCATAYRPAVSQHRRREVAAWRSAR